MTSIGSSLRMRQWISEFLQIAWSQTDEPIMFFGGFSEGIEAKVGFLVLRIGTMTFVALV